MFITFNYAFIIYYNSFNKNDDSNTVDPTQGEATPEQTPEVTPKEVKYVVTFDIDGVKNSVEVIEGEKVPKQYI